MGYPQKLLIIGTLLSFMACGSAAEFSPSSAQGTDTATAGADPVTVAAYQFTYDPTVGTLQAHPVSFTQGVAQNLLMSAAESAALGQSVNTNIALSSFYTNVYDSGANSLRLFSGGGPTGCIQNTESKGKHMAGLTATFNLFHPSSVSVTEGASNPSSGTYVLDYGDIANSDTACRGFSVSNPSGVAMQFAANFAATLTDAAPTQYVSKVDFTAWPATVILEGEYHISGKGFSPGGKAPTVTVGGVEIAISSYSDTQIGLPGDGSIPVVNGILQVTNDKGDNINGPYITTPTRALIAMQLQAGDGTVTRKMYWRAWSSANGLDGTNCPPNVALQDAEVNSYLTLSGTSALFPVMMENISYTGDNLKIYLWYDMNNNGQLDTADYFFYDGDTDGITAGTQINLGSVFFGGTNHPIANCSAIN